MKYYNFYGLIFIAILSFSCKKEVSNNNKNDTIKENNISDNLIQKENNKYYVSAESGLNYRQRPKEKILGKFELNEIVTVIHRTGSFQTIEDNEKQIKGEWVGIKKGIDTVYVFDGFLSKEKIFLDANVTKVMVDYYNDNYGVSTILVETKGDTLRGLNYYAQPEYEGEDHGFILMAVDVPRRIGSKGIHYGDLNNDGLEDMIIPVHTEGGGGGGNVWWTDLFVFFKQNKEYKFITTKSNWGVSGCDNYGFVFFEKIENNIIYGESTCYAEEDGRCCPSLTFKTKFKLKNKEFVVVGREDITAESQQ